MGGFLDSLHLRRQLLPDLHVKFVFQRAEFLLRAENGPGQLQKLFRRISLRVGEGLAADVIIRHQVFIRIGHFYVITEHFIVSHPEIFYAGLLPLPFLKLCQPGLSFGLGFLEMVDLLMISLFQNTAFLDWDRRVFLDRFLQQSVQVFQGIQVFSHLRQHTLAELPQNIFNVWQILNGSLKGNEIPRIGGTVADLHGQSLQVVDGVHVLPQLFSGHYIFFEHLHGVQPLLDGLLVDERLLYHITEHPGAHGSLSFVKYPEQTSLLGFLSQSLAQFQIPPGGAVQHHIILSGIRRQLHEMGQGCLLGLMKILQQSAACHDAERVIGKTDAFQIDQMVLLLDHFLAVFRLKIIAGHRGDDCSDFFFYIFKIHTTDTEAVVADNLCRLKLVHLIQQGVLMFQLGCPELSRGQVADSDTEFVILAENAHNIVVSALVQTLGQRIGTRRHHPDDVSFYDSLCRLRILHLLADGDAVSPLHQFIDIRFAGMKRNAAHRRPLLLTAVLSRQSNLQLF